MGMNDIKSVVFLSNFFNHHQKPFSDEMFNILKGGYHFIETGRMPEERKSLGYWVDYPDYVVRCDDFLSDIQNYKKLIDDADAVIIGSAPEILIENRKKLNKLIFRYSERPLRYGIEPLKYLPRLLKWHKKNPWNKPIYVLCASAYTPFDYARFGLFKNKCFKFGYFPETRQYDDINSVIKNKEKNSIVWVARFIPLKHPELMLELAKKLKADGYDFNIKMIGNGALLNGISQAIIREGLSDCIEVLGSMKPEQVRNHMEKSQIHLFTSDKQEGWGAVLNEAMNSACVPISNKQIGATPFLIKDSENGFMYTDINELYEKLRFLLDNPEQRKKMAISAYKTITDEWNGEIAAQRFVKLANNVSDCLYESGPLSKAKIIMDN